MNTEDLTRSNILVLDDDRASLNAIQRALGSLGFRNLFLLSNSEHVFEALAEFRPDLVITDLEMPGVSGEQVLDLVKEMAMPWEILPVLVITGQCTPEAKRDALKRGAMDFLAKPLDVPELQTRVRNLLRIRTLHEKTQAYSRGLEHLVTERTRALERALLELKERHRATLREERLRAFAQIAGGVVHDFNNKLMAITGYSGILLNDPAALANREETLNALQIIHAAAGDAAGAVERLREFCEARDAKEPAGPVDLNEMVRQVVESTQPVWRHVARADGRRIDFELDLQNVPPVEGRSAELQEMMTHLIVNAVDAMPSGGAISCGTRRRGASVIAEIVDTGTGMPEAVRKRCTEAFFTTKGDRATGLGLAVVASILKRHGARLSIESAEGSGTKIRMEFPIRIPAPPVEEAAPALGKTAAKPLRILLVDDDPHMRKVVTRLLAGAGHSVVNASGAPEALAQVERQRFDLMVTDHAMPGINGVELAAVMRGVDPAQRVILFTGHPPQTTPSDIACVVSKPAKADEIHAAIARAMA